MFWIIWMFKEMINKETQICTDQLVWVVPPVFSVEQFRSQMYLLINIWKTFHKHNHHVIEQSDAPLSPFWHLLLFNCVFVHVLVTINVDGEFFVSGGGLSSRFRVASLNFHWGRCNASAGSEHSLNGMKYPLEVKQLQHATCSVVLWGKNKSTSTQF